MQVFGFRQSMFVSQVWYNKCTHKWAFHVSDDGYSGVPNLGEYDSYAELLYGVANFYAKRWPIADTPITIDISAYANSLCEHVQKQYA